MNKFLLTVGVLLVVVLAALFAVPHFVDWNSYRGVFEEQSSRLVGREVRVGGRVSLRLLPAPYVSFENVRVADHEGRFSEPPLRVEAFTLWLSIPPLLKGSIEASNVDLVRPDLLIQLAPGETRSATAPTLGNALLPRTVALRSVSIVDGLVRVRSATGVEITRLERIDGEFSASALDGPYRLRAALRHMGQAREVRLATGRLEQGTGLPIDMLVRVPEQSNSYAVKGRLVDVLGDPRLEGELVVQPAAERTRAKDKDAAQGAEGLPFYEVRAQLALSSSGLRLDDLLIAFEQSGRPQSLTGSASATFHDGVSIESTLKARWLDLDRIARIEPARGPLAALQRLGGAALDSVPAIASGRLTLGIDQATIGGETANAIVLALVKAADGIRLERLEAELPGNSRVWTSGTLPGRPDGPLYAGAVRLRGQSLDRLVAWAGTGAGIAAPGLDVPFALAGQLALARTAASLTRATGELGGAPLEGEVAYEWSAGGALKVTLEADRLDLRQIAGLSPTLPDAWAALVAPPRATRAAGDAKTAAAGGDSRLAEADLRLRIGRLLLAHGDLRDLVCDVRRSAEQTQVRALRFLARDGLKVAVDGRIAPTDAGRSRGALSVLLDAERPEAVEHLVRFLEAPEAQALASRAQQIAPVRLAGTLSLGSRVGHTADLQLDGALKETRASLSVRIDGDPGRWRTSPIDVTGTLDSPVAAKLLAQLLQASPALSKGGSEPARLTLRANGVLDSGLATSIELESKAVEAGFTGTLARDGGSLSASGEIGLRAADVADGLRLVGLRASPALAGHPLVLHARLAHKGGTTRVAESTVRMGDAGAEASGTITNVASGLALDLKARALDASLPGLLWVLMGQGAATARASVPADTVWPDDPIDLAALGGLTGKLRLDAGRLWLGQDLSIEKASVDGELTGAGIALSAVTGEALGGRFSGSGRIEKGAGGVAVRGSVLIEGAQLDRIRGGAGRDQPTATGRARVELAFAGAGLSPRGISASVKGSGTLALQGVEIARYAPEGLDAATERVLRAAPDEEIKLEPGAFAPIIGEELTKAPLRIGSRNIPIEIGEGTTRLKPFTVESRRGRARITAIADIMAMRVDSEWTIESSALYEREARAGAVPGQKVKSALPAVSVVLSGPLSDLSRIEVRHGVEALERELVVWRMEREVEALERLRREEEDRRREQQAREEAARSEKEAREREAQDQAARERAQQRPEGAAGWSPLTTGAPSVPVPSTAAPQTPLQPSAPVPVPVPVAPPAAASASQPIEGTEAKPPDGAAQPTRPAVPSPQRADGGAPAPKRSRAPSVFDPSRGL